MSPASSAPPIGLYGYCPHQTTNGMARSHLPYMAGKTYSSWYLKEYRKTEAGKAFMERRRAKYARRYAAREQQYRDQKKANRTEHDIEVETEKRKRKSWIQKLQVIAAYGAMCVCCGETAVEFLTIDHINGGGVKHVKSLNTTFYKFLIKNNFPKDEYRLLCMNCNSAYARYGSCPHQSRKS